MIERYCTVGLVTIEWYWMEFTLPWLGYNRPTLSVSQWSEFECIFHISEQRTNRILGRLWTPSRQAFSYGIRHIHCDSLNYESKIIESQWKHAVSRMKKHAVRESATSLLSFVIPYSKHIWLILVGGLKLFIIKTNKQTKQTKNKEPKKNKQTNNNNKTFRQTIVQWVLWWVTHAISNI